MLDESILQQIEAAAGIAGRRQAPLAGHISFGCGGPAGLLIEAQSSGRLASILKILSQHSLPWLVIGRGTNLLIADEGFPGVVVTLSGEMEECRVEGSRLICGAGASLPRAARLAAEHGLSGLEPLAQIPGTLGGAVVMNAGAFGSEISDLVIYIEVCGPAGLRTIERAGLDFGYRRLEVAAGDVISRVALGLEAADAGSVREAMNAGRERRQQSQPLGQRTFGSTFKNPAGSDSAGKLLDSAGCKDLTAGGAAVSGKHANFIVNKGNATAADVVNLMNECRRRVFDLSGIVLEPEVRLVGLSLEAI